MEQKNLYETIFIVNNTLGEESIKALVEKFTTLISSNAEVQAVNEWGVRRLAYPINDYTEGYYVLVKFVSNVDFPAELDRVYNITDGILRSLIIKCEQ
jgi:small subunit ribosomal protein S6